MFSKPNEIGLWDVRKPLFFLFLILIVQEKERVIIKFNPYLFTAKNNRDNTLFNTIYEGIVLRIIDENDTGLQTL